MPITEDGISSGHRLDLITQAQMNTALSQYMVISAINAALSQKMNNPIGITSQYINGTGALTTFPTIPTLPVLFKGSTNGSGVYSVTYSTAYSVNPNVIFAVEGGTNKDTAILTSSTTGFSILIQRRTDVVGLLPTYLPVSSAAINVTVSP
jgi:hypothetical protein